MSDDSVLKKYLCINHLWKNYYLLPHILFLNVKFLDKRDFQKVMKLFETLLKPLEIKFGYTKYYMTMKENLFTFNAPIYDCYFGSSEDEYRPRLRQFLTNGK